MGTKVRKRNPMGQRKNLYHQNWDLKLTAKTSLAGLSRTLANSTTWAKKPDKEIWIDESQIKCPRDLKKNLKPSASTKNEDLVCYNQSHHSKALGSNAKLFYESADKQN